MDPHRVRLTEEDCKPACKWLPAEDGTEAGECVYTRKGPKNTYYQRPCGTPTSDIARLEKMVEVVKSVGFGSDSKKYSAVLLDKSSLDNTLANLQIFYQALMDSKKVKKEHLDTHVDKIVDKLHQEFSSPKDQEFLQACKADKDLLMANYDQQIQLLISENKSLSSQLSQKTGVKVEDTVCQANLLQKTKLNDQLLANQDKLLNEENELKKELEQLKKTYEVLQKSKTPESIVQAKTGLETIKILEAELKRVSENNTKLIKDYKELATKHLEDNKSIRDQEQELKKSGLKYKKNIELLKAALETSKKSNKEEQITISNLKDLAAKSLQGRENDRQKYNQQLQEQRQTLTNDCNVNTQKHHDEMLKNFNIEKTALTKDYATQLAAKQFELNSVIESYNATINKQLETSKKGSEINANCQVELQELANLGGILKTLENKLVSLEKQLQTYKEGSDKYKKCQAEIQELKSRHESIISKHIVELNSKNNQLTLLNNDLQVISALNNQLQEKLESLKKGTEAHDNCQAEIKELKTLHKQIIDEQSSLFNKMESDLQFSRDQLGKNSEEYKINLAALQKELGKYKEGSDNYNKCQSDISKLKEQNQVNLNNYKNQVNNNNQQKSHNKDLFAALQKELKTFRKGSEDYKVCQSDISKLKNMYNKQQADFVNKDQEQLKFIANLKIHSKDEIKKLNDHFVLMNVNSKKFYENLEKVNDALNKQLEESKKQSTLLQNELQTCTIGSKKSKDLLVLQEALLKRNADVIIKEKALLQQATALAQKTIKDEQENLAKLKQELEAEKDHIKQQLEHKKETEAFIKDEIKESENNSLVVELLQENQDDIKDLILNLTNVNEKINNTNQALENSNISLEDIVTSSEEINQRIIDYQSTLNTPRPVTNYKKDQTILEIFLENEHRKATSTALTNVIGNDNPQNVSTLNKLIFTSGNGKLKNDILKLMYFNISKDVADKLMLSWLEQNKENWAKNAFNEDYLALVQVAKSSMISSKIQERLRPLLEDKRKQITSQPGGAEFLNEINADKVQLASIGLTEEKLKEIGGVLIVDFAHINAKLIAHLEAHPELDNFDPIGWYAFLALQRTEEHSQQLKQELEMLNQAKMQIEILPDELEQINEVIEKVEPELEEVEEHSNLLTRVVELTAISNLVNNDKISNEDKIVLVEKTIVASNSEEEVKKEEEVIKLLEKPQKEQKKDVDKALKEAIKNLAEKTFTYNYWGKLTGNMSKTYSDEKCKDYTYNLKGYINPNLKGYQLAANTLDMFEKYRESCVAADNAKQQLRILKDLLGYYKSQKVNAEITKKIKETTEKITEIYNIYNSMIETNLEKFLEGLKTLDDVWEAYPLIHAHKNDEDFATKYENPYIVRSNEVLEEALEKIKNDDKAMINLKNEYLENYKKMTVEDEDIIAADTAIQQMIDDIKSNRSITQNALNLSKRVGSAVSTVASYFSPTVKKENVGNLSDKAEENVNEESEEEVEEIRPIPVSSKKCKNLNDYVVHVTSDCFFSMYDEVKDTREEKDYFIKILKVLEDDLKNGKLETREQIKEFRNRLLASNMYKVPIYKYNINLVWDKFCKEYKKKGSFGNLASNSQDQCPTSKKQPTINEHYLELINAALSSNSSLTTKKQLEEDCKALGKMLNNNLSYDVVNNVCKFISEDNVVSSRTRVGVIPPLESSLSKKTNKKK